MAPDAAKNTLRTEHDSARAEERWRLVDIQIAGIDRVGQLLREGRVDEARDHFISCARAVWQHRWRSVRRFTLKRLGVALDTQRHPQLAQVAAALRAEEPGAARFFLDHLRSRTKPEVTSFVERPKPPAKDFDPAAGSATSLHLWHAWVAGGDPRAKEQLDRRIGEYLDPVRVISWHETNRAWARLVMSALYHGGIDDETLCKLILFGLDHAEHCNATSHLSEPPQTSIGGNHLFNWILGWLTATLLFPEFRRSPALQSSAIARLDDELSLQVMPDGSMIEGAPGYQNCCLYGASEFLRLCGEQHVALPPRVLEAWEKMIRFAVGIMKPDGRVPMIGDSQDDLVRGLASPMTRYYDIPELDWTVSEGKKGRPPSCTSKAFPCIGYYVQRTGWSPDDLYLCFNGGRFGQSHHHEDKLSFELYAHGRMMLVDCGVHSYSDHWFRRWAVTSHAHNTILVDGAGQCRWRQDRDQWYSPMPLDNRCEMGEQWDLVEADFDGPYETPIGPIVQRRRVVFHRTEPAFWWITDAVNGDGEHEVTELFHFAHDIETLQPADRGVRTRIPGGPDLAVLCLHADEVAVERYRGAQDPPWGWVSPERNALAPAWEVHFTGRPRLPMRRDFLLLPSAGELPDDVSAQLQLLPSAARLSLLIAGQRHILDLPKA